MPDCIDCLDRAMRAVSRGEVAAPPRLFAGHFDKSGVLGVMPGSAKGLDVYGAKIISLHPDNPGKGLPTIQGFVALFELATGAPVALIEGSELTAIRTAAASGLATRELARRDATTHGIFGTGVQAVTHVDAIGAVRNIERVVIWGRSEKRARDLAAEQAERTGLDIVSTTDPAEAAACDIVSAVTAAREPVLEGRWVRAGTHINLVGAHEPTAREADSDLVAKSAVYVDLMDSAMNEAGDIVIPIGEGVIGKDHVTGEIGQLLEGEVPGRANADAVTLYKSVGVVGQDLFAADYIYRTAAGV